MGGLIAQPPGLFPGLGRPSSWSDRAGNNMKTNRVQKGSGNISQVCICARRFNLQFECHVVFKLLISIEEYGSVTIPNICRLTKRRSLYLAYCLIPLNIFS